MNFNYLFLLNTWLWWKWKYLTWKSQLVWSRLVHNIVYYVVRCTITHFTQLAPSHQCSAVQAVRTRNLLFIYLCLLCPTVQYWLSCSQVSALYAQFTCISNIHANINRIQVFLQISWLMTSSPVLLIRSVRLMAIKEYTAT